MYEDVTLGLVHRGPEEIKAFRGAYVSVFPDMAVDEMSYFQAADAVCLEWTMSGTHEGDLPDLAATGRRFVLRGVRTDEGWKISRREQTVLWVDGNSAVLSF